jgi:hypothetical protein
MIFKVSGNDLGAGGHPAGRPIPSVLHFAGAPQTDACREFPHQAQVQDVLTDLIKDASRRDLPH